MSIMTQDSLDQAAAVLASDPARAERIARAIVARAPTDPRPRLILASALRRLNRPIEAMAFLSDLVRAYPKAARSRYEFGLCLCTAGRADEGDRQLAEAARLDPAHVETWEAIEMRAFARGDAARELQAQAVLARLSAGHPDLGRAAQLVLNNRHAEAEPTLQKFCIAHPGNPEGFRLMAACQVARHSFSSAETLLQHALTLAPEARRIRFDLAHTLYAARRAGQAMEQLAPLLAADPPNVAYRNLHAACLALLGDDEGAEAIHAELAAAFPENARIAINHGHAARTAGLRDTAIAAYRRATARAPQSGESWWSLANLKIGALTQADEAEMRRQLRGRLLEADRMHVEYALALRLEDAGKVAESFAHYLGGATLARRLFNVAPRDYAGEAAHVAGLFTAEFMARHEGCGAQDDAPIFIVGLPRSGSTLVEQILASHPAIEGTMELPYIGIIADRIEQEGGAQRLAKSTPDELRGWGEEYLRLAQVHRRMGRARFIDKMPNNFRHIGLIRLILPNAKIIDVRRHPMAACFSGYKQLFAEGQEFSYSQQDLAAYYRHYLAIVRHFHDIRPGAVHTLLYEDLVDDTEAQIRLLLDAIGVPFDPATLRFFENERAVRTVSSEQVRRPIYRSGLDHWRKFEPFLAELATGLGPDLAGWRQ